MCGRYIANSEDEVMEIREILKQISMRFVLPKTAEAALSEMFPTNQVMLINKSESVLAKWGIEKWDNKGVIINAKSETYEQSRFFGSFADNRCIIPAHGYYEWHNTASRSLTHKKKIKYAFTSGERHGIFMAGVYNKQGEFAIITKPAEPKIRFIHDRMPLIIHAEQAADWLNGKISVKGLCEVNSGITWKETG